MASGIVETTTQDATQMPVQGPSRSKLVQRLLGTSANLPAFLNDLLSTMAVVVAGTEAAGFLIERDAAAEGAKPAGQTSVRPICHIRPDDSDDATRAKAIEAFKDIIAPCITQNKDGAIEVGSPDGGEPQFCLVTLLRSEGFTVAAAAVITRCRDQERAKQRLQSMQLVAGYFELYTMRRGVEQTRAIAQSHQNMLQLSAAIGTAEGFESSAMNLCNELTTRVGASRVSLGWVKGRNVKVRAMSHTEKFDKKQELVVQLKKAMEECADQEEPVRFDFDGERSENVTRDAEALSRAQGGNSVFSAPLRRKDEVIGVITVEWAPPHKLTPQVAESLVVAADVLSPQVFDRHANDRNIAVKVGLSAKHGAELAIGPKHMIAKLVIVGVIAALVSIFAIRPMYHVSAPFQLTAIDKRVLSAPFDGVLQKINENPRTHEKYRAGDMVQKGEVLAQMDTSELHQKYYEAESKANSKEQEAIHDLSDPKKIAEYKMAKDDEAAARAEMAFFQDQISRADIAAPFGGVLIQGDVSSKEGAALHIGDVLFELANLNDLKAELAVSERDVKDLHLNQNLSVATNGQPGQSFDGHITRIVPEGQVKDNENTFQVYAKLDKTADWMRPGMEGEARVDVEHRSIAWIWTHRLIDFLRLKLWSL